jgi:hypothetical protein
LDTAISTDVVISLKPNGTAIYNSDFIADFLSKGTATTVAGGNGPGGAMNQLYYPSDVSVASDGTIYVLDPNNGRIQNGDRLLCGNHSDKRKWNFTLFGRYFRKYLWA